MTSLSVICLFRRRPLSCRYATLCSLAGVPTFDALAAAAVPPVPPVESLDLWPLLSGSNGTSPRTEILVAQQALIFNSSRLLKLLVGDKLTGSGWAGPSYPNTSTPGKEVRTVVANCTPGCLFDLDADPEERNDLARKEPALLKQMTSKLTELIPKIWHREKGSVDFDAGNDPACMMMAFSKWGGFIGPYGDLK